MTIEKPNQPNSSNQAIQRLPPSPRGSIREMVRDPLGFFLGLTRQYGDIVCYRPAPETAYLVNHPDAIRHVLVDNYRNYSKDTYSIQVFKKVVGDGLVTSEGEAWRQQRRLMQPAFHHSRLEKLDSLIVASTQGMLRRWQVHYQNGEPIDIARAMASLTLTITTQVLFGVDLGEQVNAIGEWVNQAALQFEKPSHPRVQESAHGIRAVVQAIIQQRRQNFSDRGDLLSSMLIARQDDGNELFSDQALADQVMDLLIAGYETTANALTWTWYLLSQHPWAARRMQSEIQARLGDREPQASDLAHLPFTRMVFEESLRLYSPGWMIGRRAIASDEIGGYHVAPGTVIAICTYTLHRHPGYWEQPEIFDPTRFDPQLETRRHKFAYLPFGAGPRQCIGNHLAMLEAGLIMACVGQRFDLHLVDETEVQPQPLFVLRPKRDLMVILKAV